MLPKFLKAIILVLFTSALSLNAQGLSFEEEILNEVNIYRQSKGLKPLINNAMLSQIAQKHSRDMALGKVSFGHGGFKKRVKKIEKTIGLGATAENVAYGYSNAKELVQGWINSPGHRKNMEGDYEFSGIGIFQSKKGVPFFTHLFYTPIGY